MTPWLDRILGLRSLSTRGEGVEWRFAHPLPAWIWVGIVVACFVAAGWSYSQLLGSRQARTALAIIRGLVFTVLALLIAGPELVRQNERVEQDWVVVMADRSASMTVADVVADGGKRTTRESQLHAAFATGEPLFRDLAAKRQVLFEGFDATAFDLTSAQQPGSGPVELGTPGGRRTMLGQSLEQVMRRIAARPVAGIVLFTDGRSPDQPSRALIRQLQAKRVAVFPVPLGQAATLPDLAITRVEAPGAAFVGDKVPVAVDVESLGSDGASPASGRLQLIDASTGAVVEERNLAESRSEGRTRMTMLVTPSQAGAARYQVKVIPDGDDLSAENNVAQVVVDVADRPIRVVYFDGYPRWEYRYLKNILVREKSIRTSAMLLASERRSIQDGNEVLDAVPRTLEGWRGFDVIVMGDVRPEVFSNEQLGQIRELVAQRGAGLLWIGGAGSTPGAWRGTPLADLIPFTMPPQSAGGSEHSGLDAWLQPVLVKPAAAASRYGVLQLSEDPQAPWPAELLNDTLGWPLMRWAQRIETGMLKPSAEVLATATPISGSSQTPAPLVMSMRYGAGRVVYVATDETWRYRYCRGEVLTERFWIPVVRLLARESLGRSGKPAMISASPEQVRTGQQVQISVKLLDQSLVERKPGSLRVRLVRAAEQGRPAGRPVELALAPASAEGGADASLTSEFIASWVASEPGSYSVEPADAMLAGLDLRARLDVVTPDDEMRSPQTDHAALERLAKETGGQVIAPDQLDRLPSLLPNREVRILGTPDVETLWDKPIAFFSVLLLLAIEWLWRRLIKLA